MDNRQAAVLDALARYQPAELVLNADAMDWKAVMEFVKLRLQCTVSLRDDSCFDPQRNHTLVLNQFQVSSLQMLGLTEEGPDACAVCGMFDYIRETQKIPLDVFFPLISAVEARQWDWI